MGYIAFALIFLSNLNSFIRSTERRRRAKIADNLQILADLPCIDLRFE